MVAIGPVSWAFSLWVRARHGYPLDDSDDRSHQRAMWGGWGTSGWSSGQGQGGRGSLDAERRIELLTDENHKLAGQVSRLEERLRVLERIATDPAIRTAREIDALRD